MLIDEAAAKLKFCPFGRGVVPLKAGSEKFASGINTSPNGPLTVCEGSGCMLWETQQIINEARQTTCPTCEGKSPDCKACSGKGEVTIQVPHHIGFCGAGFQGPLAAGVTELNKTLAAILVTVRGQQQKAANDGDHTMHPEGGKS